MEAGKACLRNPRLAATCIFRAVAENQPGHKNQNRMKTPITLEQFATLCREFIQFSCSQAENQGQPDPLQSSFDHLAVSLFRLQFAHNTAYRRLCELRNITVKQVGHWFEIPSAPASSFKLVDMSCLPPEQRDLLFCSSGTTGQQPSRHYHNDNSLLVYESSLLPWFKRHLRLEPEILSGSNASDPVLLSLTPPAAEVPHSSLTHMLATIERRMKWSDALFAGRVQNGGWGLNIQAVANCLQRATESNRLVVILGTAFSFVHLLDHLSAVGLQFQLPRGSRVMETGGYKGRSRALTRPELHALITDRLGIASENIVCEYGMTELSSQAYDRAVSATAAANVPPNPTRRFRFPPWARVQIISPETGQEVAEGETGLIRVFDLANVYSVLAIQTEDLAVRSGNGFELIGRPKTVEPRGCSLNVAVGVRL
jgi:hypothetical protein